MERTKREIDFFYLFFFPSKVPTYRKKKQLYRCLHRSEVIIGFSASLSAQVSFAFLWPLDVSACDRHRPDVWQNAWQLGNDGFKKKKKKKKRFDSSELIASTSYPRSRAGPTGVSHPGRFASFSREEECFFSLASLSSSSFSMIVPPRPEYRRQESPLSIWLNHTLNVSTKVDRCFYRSAFTLCKVYLPMLG